nr:unnamed protein product [Naegleria fowleri]
MLPAHDSATCSNPSNNHTTTTTTRNVHDDHEENRNKTILPFPLLEDESKPTLKDWFTATLSERTFKYEYKNRSEESGKSNKLVPMPRGDDQCSLNHILNQVLFQNDHRKSSHQEKYYLNLFFDLIEHSGKKHNNSIFCEGVVIVGGMKSWGSSEFYNQKSSRSESQTNFHIEEVFWLSPSDSKLAPCPLFNRLNLERVNAKIIDEYKVDTSKRHNKEEYFNDFLFAIVVDNDRDSETVTLSQQFEEHLTDFVTFPVHTLLSTQPPCYNSLRDREEVLKKPFNSILERKSWFIDPLESHILLERFFREPLISSSIENHSQNTIQENRANELIQQMQSSWLDETIKNNTENYQSLRKKQDSRYSVRCVLKGVDYAKQKNFEKALDCYHDALHYDEKNVDAIVGIGSALYNQKQYHRALDEFINALHIDPNHEIARQYLEKTRVKLESLVKEREQQNRKRKFHEEYSYQEQQRMQHLSRMNEHYYTSSSSTVTQHPDRTSFAHNYSIDNRTATSHSIHPQQQQHQQSSTVHARGAPRALESTLKKILNSPEKKTKR